VIGGGGGGGNGSGGSGSGGSGDDADPCALGCAQSNGDPHLVTVDHHLYDFQAAGEFTLLRSPDGTDEFQGRQIPWPGSDHLAINRAIAARVGSHRVSAYNIAGRFEVHVDGAVTPTDAPIDLSGGGRIVPYPAGIELDLPDGTRAWIIVVGRWGLMARIAPSPALAAGASGLLGSVQPGLGLPALPDGSPLPAASDAAAARAARYGTFADAWRVTDATSLFDYAPGTTTATFTVAGFPAAASTSDTLADLSAGQRAAGEQACAAITALDLHDACAFDAGATGEADAADAYTLAQAFDTTGPAALAGAPSPGAPSTSPSAPETLPPLASMPAGISELVPEAQALLGQAMGPDDRLYLSVRLADGTAAVITVDAMLISTPVQAPADGGGPVAVAGGSAWVGELRADGTCAIARFEPHSIAQAATVPITCDQGQAAIAALGNDLWYVDTTGIAADGTGAVLRRLDPSNQPSSTAIPIPIPLSGTTLSEGTEGASIVLSSNDHTLFLAKGAAAFTDLGPLPQPVFGVSTGVWAADPAGSTATLHGPTGVLGTVQLGGHLVGADYDGVLVEIPGSTADTLNRAQAGNSYPVLIGSGSQIDTAAGTTVPLGYLDAWPLVVGTDHAIKMWLPTSRTNPSAVGIDAQWPVERAARDPGLRGDTSCRVPPRAAGCDERIHTGERLGDRWRGDHGGIAALSRPTDDDDDLAPRRDRAVGGHRGELGERAPRDLLVELRELPAHRARTIRAARRREVPERGRRPARRLEHDRSALVGRDPRQPLATLAARPRQESLERPAWPGGAARRHGREHRRSSGDRHDRSAGRRPGRNEPLPRVRYHGGARVGHKREVGAALEVGEELALARRTAASVVADRARADLVAVEQPAADPGVLGGNERDGLEDLERPERDIAQVADRRGDDVQRAAARTAGRDGRHAQGRAEPGRRRGYR
jgi:hypothetical protein